MRRISFIFIQMLFLSSFLIDGNLQAQIQGAVKDTNMAPVSYANVLLLDAEDSTVVSGTMATEEGVYKFTNFKPGTYIIGVNLIGYSTEYSSNFTINSSNQHIHIEPVHVKENAIQIDEAAVVTKKPIYDLQIDRMVINVENSVSSVGSTALDVLEKSPGVIVDRQNNSLSLSGKDGVIVIINGKQNRMPMEAAMQMLDAMNADNIKKIEIITTPPAKYDAEGNAGIINIVLKKNEDFGTNGSFTLGAGVSKREKMNGSLSLNHHVNKVNFFGSYNVNFNNGFGMIKTTRRYEEAGMPMRSEAVSDRDFLLLFQNIRMGFDYTISSKTVLSFLGMGYIRDWELDALNSISYYQNQMPAYKRDMQINEYNKWIHGLGNLNLQHNFEEDEVLDINIDYLNYYNDSPSDYSIETFNNSDVFIDGEEIEVTKRTPINIGVGMIDYSNQLSKQLKLELGLKGTISHFNNDVGVKYFIDDRWNTDPEMTNDYVMKENIGAAYSSVNYQFNDSVGLIIGLRYEYMNTTLDSKTEKGIIDQGYGEFFPTLFFSNKLLKNLTLQLSYSRRIDRPSYTQLAPFIIFMTPESFVAGNENLLPAISNNFKIEFLIKKIILSAGYSNTENAIFRFQPRYSEDESKQYYISRNFDENIVYNANLGLPITVAKWWKMQNNVTWSMNKSSTNYEGVDISNTYDRLFFNSSQSFTINQYLSTELSGFYRSKSGWGVYKSFPAWRMDLGMQWRLKNGTSKFTANFTDVFKTAIWRSEAEIPELNIYTSWHLDFEPRVFRISFSQTFGNSTAKARQRGTASEEERRRVSTD